MYNLQITVLLLIITTGRLISIAITVLGIISLIIARQALFRSPSSLGTARSKAITALVMGLAVVLLSIIHLSLSTGSFGTGSGKLGAIVAMLLGLTGSTLGALALKRVRRMAN